jgi:hypothetical protein
VDINPHLLLTASSKSISSSILEKLCQKNNKHLKFVSKNSEQNALFDLEKSYYRKMLGYEPDPQKLVRTRAKLSVS